MINYNLIEPSVGMCLWCIFLYLFIIMVSWRKAMTSESTLIIKKRRHSNTSFLAFFCGLVIVYFLTDFINTDYFHYYETINKLDYYHLERVSLEKYYTWILPYINFNYIIFRLFVWGPAFLLFIITIKRFNLPILTCLFFFSVCYLDYFAYSRASLAMTIYFFAISFICRPFFNKWLSLLISVAIISQIMLFHKSAILMVIASSFLLIPINKKTIIASVFVFPIIVMIASSFFNDIVGTTFFDEDIINSKLESYANTVDVRGLAKNILQPVKFSSFYITFAVVTKAFFFNKNIVVKKEWELLYKVTYGLMIIATSFLFLDLKTLVFFYRALFMVYIPLSILITIAVTERIIARKTFLIVLTFGFISHFVPMLYALYCSAN